MALPLRCASCDDIRMSTAVPRETWGDVPIRREKLRIGLSYDQGTPKYRLYLGALLAAGDWLQQPLEVVWLAGATQGLDREATRSVDGLVLTGGADVEPGRYGSTDAGGDCKIWPGRDETELAVLDSALARRIPILAICRGMQLLNVARGGTLVPEIDKGTTHQLDDARRHLVRIEGGTMLRKLLGIDEGEATSSHHQAIAQLGKGLRVCATHKDGTVEAIEWSDPMRKAWMLGVQWHPERMTLDEPLAGPLYRGFLEAVSARRV